MTSSGYAWFPIKRLIGTMKARYIKLGLTVAAAVLLFLSAHEAGTSLGEFWYHVTHP